MNMDHELTNREVLTRTTLAQSYLWMFFGLGITAFASYITSNSVSMMQTASSYYFIFLILELALVFIISLCINKLSQTTAGALFVIYATLNGVTLSLIFQTYSLGSIGATFVICALTFAAASIYGFVTKKDLTSMGSFLFMALIGLIIASAVNIFLHNSMFDFIISIVGVLVFILITAYDTQKIKENYYQSPVLAALALYLDFINLLLYMLRLFGSKK
jgi:FtsH-binding integral membrane protein